MIVPVVQSKLLDRMILYTAIPRSMKTVVLVGDIDLINEIVAAIPKSLDREQNLRFNGI